jgi:hypothetical protein
MTSRLRLNDLRINYVTFFIPRCGPNTEHYLQFTLFRVYLLLCKRVLIPQQPTCCLANRVNEPLSSNGRLFWIHYSGFRASFYCWQRNLGNMFSEPLPSTGYASQYVQQFVSCYMPIYRHDEVIQFFSKLLITRKKKRNMMDWRQNPKQRPEMVDSIYNTLTLLVSEGYWLSEIK